MPKSLNFMFYANASASIGAGHIMRLLSLIQASKAAQQSYDISIELSFAYCECPVSMQGLLQEEGCRLIALPPDFSGKDLSVYSPDVLFIDDYELNESQLAAFSQSQAFLVRLDDNINTAPIIGDLIINAASNANKDEYRKRNEHAILCLGPQFSVLRKEFWKLEPTPLSERKKILLSLGASDVKSLAYSLSKALLQKLSGFEDTTLCVLLGGLNNESFESLQELALSYHQLEVIQHSDQVSSLMMETGLAISAAGGTLNELACTATPAIALVTVDNQRAALEVPTTEAWYVAHDIRDFDANNKQHLLSQQSKDTIDEICTQSHELWRDLCKRKALSQIARQKIDGKGCIRIIDNIMTALLS